MVARRSKLPDRKRSMLFQLTLHVVYNGRCQCCSRGTKRENTKTGSFAPGNLFLNSFDVTRILSYREFWDLESKMADEWSTKDLIDSAIREVNQD